MPTAQNIIEGALRLIGNSSPTPTELNNAFASLNDMISLWNTNNLMIYAIIEENFTLTVGKSSYTIGSGGDFNTVRPVRIVNAFIRDSNNNDHEVDTTMSMEEYNEIVSKTSQGRPSRLYYATEYPLGKIYFNSKPIEAETLYLFSWKPFTEFASLSTNVNLPAEYNKALKYNLAVDLAPEYNVTIQSSVYNEAMLSKMNIENLHAQPISPAKFEDYITKTFER